MGKKCFFTLSMDSNTLYTEAQELLKRHWGFSSFRKEQEEPIQAFCNGQDVLAILPTGAGKSLCFQIPGLVRGGLCLVISPLIALMKEQVQDLKHRGIPSALISSEGSYGDMDRILNNATFGGLKFLYMAPERVHHDLFLARVSGLNIQTIAIDEAHCISQWGHDFRPAYRKIIALKELCPKAAWGAFTATATTDVMQDITSQLKLKDGGVFQSPMRRPNLHFGVSQYGDAEHLLIEHAKQANGTGLVYAGTRKDANLWALRMQQAGLRAMAYHAGLSANEKSKRQHRWMQGEIQVLACTSAFGMGIDKPDVRWVYHAYVPNELESYIQEAGRGGRDGQTSTCFIFSSKKSITSARDRIIRAFPSKEIIRQVYQGIANQGVVAVGDQPKDPTPFHVNHWCEQHQLPFTSVESAILLLQKEGYLTFSEIKQAPFLKITRLQYLDMEELPQGESHVLSDLTDWLNRHIPLNSGPISVPWKEITKATDLQEDILQVALERLGNWGWIQCDKGSMNRMIHWIQPRIRTESISISPLNYEERKGILLEKWEQMKKYLEGVECRASALESYFGQAPSKPCGTCDACFSRIGIDQQAFLKAIPAKGLPIKTWLSSKPLLEQASLIQGISHLRDEGKISVHDGIVFHHSNQ